MSLAEKMKEVVKCHKKLTVAQGQLKKLEKTMARKQEQALLYTNLTTDERDALKQYLVTGNFNAFVEGIRAIAAR